MADHVATGTFLGHCSYNEAIDGWGYSATEGYTTSHNVDFGYSSGDIPAEPYVLKFITPDFLGVYKGAKVTLNITPYGVSGQLRAHYALCTSDANKDNYINTLDAVSDDNQIETGELSVYGISGYTGGTVEISLNKSTLKPNTEYYLFIWPNHSNCSDLSVDPSPAVIVNYADGVIYIDNGTEVKPYLCYIDTGTEWKPVLPYIDNGTGWDACS